MVYQLIHLVGEFQGLLQKCIIHWNMQVKVSFPFKEGVVSLYTGLEYYRYKSKSTVLVAKHYASHEGSELLLYSIVSNSIPKNVILVAGGPIFSGFNGCLAEPHGVRWM